MVGNAGRVLVAQECHISAKGNGGNLPSGSIAVGEPEQLRPEADGENQHPDATPTGDQEVAKLVEEYHKAKNEEDRSPACYNSLQNFHSYFPGPNGTRN